MSTDCFRDVLPILMRELAHGAPDVRTPTYMLNRGDVGLLASLDRVSAESASATPTGGASSVAHLAYHFGAIRQIDRAARGPTAEDEAAVAAAVKA